MGGELELTAGKMGAHFTLKGIALQRTVPYAHQQNGKSERCIRTLEEGGQALLADSGLPMSFWLDAILTCQYLINRLPTSTLPPNITPFKLIKAGRKPDLSHLRVWGCNYYVAVPDEFEAKLVLNVSGQYLLDSVFAIFLENILFVVFNENTSARLGVPHPLPLSISDIPPLPSSRPLCDRP